MRRRSAESDVLLLCARQRLGECCARRVTGLCGREDFRWPALFRAAVAHDVAALGLANLQKLDIAGRMPPALLERWKAFQVRAILTKKTRARTIGELVEFF